MVPTFDFYNCKFGRRISDLTELWNGITLNVTRFDNVTGLSGEVVEDYFMGLAGANFVNSNVNGRDVTLQIKAQTNNGRLTADISGALMYFFGMGEQIRIYSNCNTSHNAKAYLEGYVEAMSIPRINETLKDCMTFEIKVHCGNPYWIIKDEGLVTYSSPLSYSQDDGGYIVFEYDADNEVDDRKPPYGNALTGLRIDMRFSSITVEGTELIIKYDDKNGKYDYGPWAGASVHIGGGTAIIIFKGAKVKMDTGRNYPYATRNTEYIPDRQIYCSEFYDNPYLFAFPNGFALKCILKSADTVAYGGYMNYNIEHDLLFV